MIKFSEMVYKGIYELGNYENGANVSHRTNLLPYILSIEWKKKKNILNVSSPFRRDPTPLQPPLPILTNFLGGYPRDPLVRRVVFDLQRVVRYLSTCISFF